MNRSESEFGGKNTSGIVGGMEIFLQPGELYFGGAPTTISSVLRSRVILTFWHPQRKIGGMCHIVLADAQGNQQDMRYAECAIAEFNRIANKYKTNTREYETRIYGGSGMLPDMQNPTGKKNGGIALERVKEILKDNHFEITDISIAEVSSRKLNFDLSDGNVKVVNSAAPEAGINRTIEQQDKTSLTQSGGEDVMEIFLHPGEMYFGKAPAVISTLLGSCVAVTLWHPKKHIGGMCHIVLPESPQGACDMKYGDCAIAEFAKQAVKYSTRSGEYKVHVYGGSDMFPDMKKSSNMNIGGRNIAKVNELLELYKFRVDEVDTGGNNSRKIKLDLSNGSVMARKTGKSAEG
ncbi:MAG: hypothetical protein OEZ39_06080 [Gammaproteobacteria bacterium]|nr:hypothetical protein [Gammaproteobacteria bacterium]MDH5651423.1 hypothetical protein [Gammaproteobacteria bacterium]